ncbi:DUF411 domain-containing protein [Rhodothermus marinus]|uniref:DUF411 domain-containing protein n=1 Tax=Rhodothermus marinus (strain ATCC 43812 / DSM 4252 / R-10) TaxID=518766 RepID=D0MIF8_RHOM4|nr:DUF411 domain-containing protein [Rhodothermus marinus]ACY48266.1 protein of unknown function DUF411 [Rhodothermus marinus DSM 4252]
MRITRKTYVLGFLLGAALAAVGLALYSSQQQASAQPTLTVFKSPTCGCCGKWVEHMKAAGFNVRVEDVQDLSAIKARFHVPGTLHSCHTAIVEGYVIEGHVPAADVWRLLREKPDVTGLAVPGMPIGSPGMEQGFRVDPYDVLAFTTDGQTRVFARYGQE